MTLKELSVLHDLNREIDMDRRRLLELEEQDGTKAQKAKVRKQIREKTERIWAEREKMERWITSIPDSLTRQIFTLRFVDGRSWVQVAAAVGGDNTPDTVRMIAKRYAKRAM